MRPTSLLAALALGASCLVLAQPATAMQIEGRGGPNDRAKLECAIGVLSADDRGRVRYDSVYNGKVENSLASKNKLGFDVDAWGEYTDTSKKGVHKLTMTSVTGQGIRLVTLAIAKGKKIQLSWTKPTQKFDPVLFTDNYYFYAYTISGSGDLLRWTWTKYRNGTLKFTDKVVVGQGFGNVTSLQASALYEKNKVWKQPLYATTAEGALLQITVPLKKPGNETVKELLPSGYEGVTELSWSICNNKYEHIALAAIDPETGVGTWTTIQDSQDKPKATLQGEIKGGKGWKGVTALY